MTCALSAAWCNTPGGNEGPGLGSVAACNQSSVPCRSGASSVASPSKRGAPVLPVIAPVRRSDASPGRMAETSRTVAASRVRSKAARSLRSVPPASRPASAERSSPIGTVPAVPRSNTGSQASRSSRLAARADVQPLDRADPEGERSLGRRAGDFEQQVVRGNQPGGGCQSSFRPERYRRSGEELREVRSASGDPPSHRVVTRKLAGESRAET